MHNLDGKTNARNVINRTRQAAPVHSPARFERIASDLVLGPAYIYVRRDQSDREQSAAFELVLRIALWKSGGLTSWSLYCQGPNDVDPEDEFADEHIGVILRHASYNRSLTRAIRAWESQRIPDLTLETRYMSEAYKDEVFVACEPLDELFRHGIEMQETPSDKMRTQHSVWTTLSLLRKLDDFSIDLCCGEGSRNRKLEDEAFNVARAIERLLERHREVEPDTIEELEMAWDDLGAETAELFEDNGPDDY